MQPYLFPYLGYFQLIRAVDRFVLLDDAAYIRRGWINRNVLASRDRPQPFVFPVAQPPRGAPIRDVRLHGFDRSAARFRRTLTALYGRAPFFGPVTALVDEILATGSDNLALLIRRSLDRLLPYLGMDTPLVSSGERHAAIATKGAARIIDICRAEGATDYVNPEGGTALYDPRDFAAQGIRLRFLRHRPVAYERFGGPFLERLSILDVLMFNAPEAVAAMLPAYDLLPGGKGGSVPWRMS
jgi:hypothetical protein